MFAGAGGIALGFIQAGFEIEWSNEFDSYACDTYRYNFPNHTLIEGDVTVVNPKDVGGVDVITSGFPCQAFSLAGRRRGFDDPRGNLFFETAKFIDELKPKAYLLENVKNLAAHDGGRTLEVIRDVLVDDLNYSYIPFILSAYAHGNTPQGRERIYIVGFSGEGNIPYTEYLDATTTTGKFLIPGPIELTKSYRDLIDETRQPDKYYFPDNHMYMKKLKETINSKAFVYQWRRKYVRTNKRGLCPTLTANMGAGGHNVPLILDDYGIRKLTPRECFRFQGFPDTYSFPENMSDARLYKQAGNSVTVPVIKRIAENIKKALDN
jgi:DNA (cytosine-5)-methyltransferase 1